MSKEILWWYSVPGEKDPIYRELAISKDIDLSGLDGFTTFKECVDFKKEIASDEYKEEQEYNSIVNRLSTYLEKYIDKVKVSEFNIKRLQESGYRVETNLLDPSLCRIFNLPEEIEYKSIVLSLYATKDDSLVGISMSDTIRDRIKELGYEVELMNDSSVLYKIFNTAKLKEIPPVFHDTYGPEEIEQQKQSKTRHEKEEEIYQTFKNRIYVEDNDEDIFNQLKDDLFELWTQTHIDNKANCKETQSTNINAVIEEENDSVETSGPINTTRTIWTDYFRERRMGNKAREKLDLLLHWIVEDIDKLKESINK